MDIVNFGYMTVLPFVNILVPFNYGFAFNWNTFIGVSFIYLITTIESKGDLTATSMLSSEPVEGEIYMSCIKGVFWEMESTLQERRFSTLPQTRP